MNLHNTRPHLVARSAPLLAILFSLGFVFLPGEDLDNPPVCCSCISGTTTVRQIDTSDGTTILMESQPLDSSECLKGQIDQNGKVKLEFTVPNNCAYGSKPRVKLTQGGLGSAVEQAVDNNGVATFELEGWSTDTELTVQILCAQEDSVCEKGCIRLRGCDDSCSGSCERGSSGFGGNASDDGQEGHFSGSIGIGTGNNGELSTSLEFQIPADRNLELADLKVSSGGAYIKTQIDHNSFSMETGTAFVVVDRNTLTDTLTLDYYFDSGMSPAEKFRTVTIENTAVAGVDNAIKVGVTDVLNATTRYFAFHYRAAAKQWDYLSGSANGSDWMRRKIVTRGTATASERTERVKVVEQAMGQSGIPDPASDDTVSDVERTYELFGTAWRVIRETIDPGGDALVSEWSYWLNGETTGPASSAGVGRLKWHGRYDGYEEHWNYAENWQSVSRTWRSNMLAETVETTWNPATNTSTVTTTRNNYNAGLVTRTYDFANRTVTESRKIDSTLTTDMVTTYRATGADFGGRIDKVVHFDDTITTYDYDRTGGVMTLTTKTGAGTTSVTEGEQTEMKYDALGGILESKVTAIGTGAGIVLQHMEVTDTDGLGRPTEKSYFPDGSGGSAYTETMSYLCCGLGTETDRYGVTTSHTYDLLGRRTSSTRLGVTLETVHEGLTTKQHRYPALGSASSANEIARTVRNVSDTEIDHYAPSPQTGALVLMEEERSTWLNPLGTPNSLGNTGGRKVVRTRIQVADDGAETPSQTTWYNRDGTFYETTGNLETKRREHWAQYNGRLYHYLYDKNAAGTSYLVTLTGYDNLGSVSYVNDKMRYTSYVKNTKNQVIRSYGDGGTGNVIVDNYEYDAKGDRVVTARSLNSATSINYGADPITATLTYPAMRGSIPVIRTETRVWQPGDSTSYSGGGGTVASYSDRTPDGLQSWNELFPTTTVATEHGGNGSNQGYGLTHAITTLSGGGTWTVFETRADGTEFKQFHVAGRLDYAALEDDIGTTIEATYYRNTVSGAVGSGYDSFGRVVHVTDLHRGKTTTAFVSDTSDHVASDTDPGGRVTAYTYDHRGRMKSEIKDAGVGKINAETTFTHYIDGLLKEQDGDLTYRVSYTYDFAGRKQTMTTYGTVTATTTWNYNYSFQGYGNLLTKTDHLGNGAVYTYDRGGRLKTRRWDRGNWTRYVYDAAGRLIARLYFTAATTQSTVLSATAGNDPHTPDAHFALDRLGRTTEALTIATSSGGSLLHPGTRRVSDHHPDSLGLDHETVQVDPDIAGPGNLGTVDPSFERHLYKRQDAIMRGTGHYIHTAPTATPTTGFEGKSLYAYDATGQIGTITGHLDGADKAFGYGRRYYSTGAWRYGSASGQKSAKVFEVYLPVTGARRSLYYEKSRDVFVAVVNWGPSNQYSVFYHNNVNALGQRINSQQYGPWFSIPFPNSATRPYYRNYDYNDTGEVVSHDVLNPSSVQLTAQLRGYDYDGIGNREAAIEGDTDPTQPGAVSYTPNVLNQYTDIGGTLSPVYDTDGNLEQGPLPVNPTQLNDLEWDGENRLRKVDVAGGASVLYTYDAYGRRTVSYTDTTRTYTLWDGWHPEAEYTGGNHTTGAPTAITRRHTWLWGLDLTETLGGAGGVGGLLADEIHTGTHAGVYYPLYDGNGNVAHYLDSAGALAAHFEYDPFGKLAVPPYESATGLAAELRFRFSTKYDEPVTGLYYYGYRWYDPLTGRWPSRDPIGEKGGSNLYGFVGNDGINLCDLLGLIVTVERNEGSGQRRSEENGVPQGISNFITNQWGDSTLITINVFSGSAKAHTREDVTTTVKKLLENKDYEKVFVFINAHGQIVGENYKDGNVVSGEERVIKGHYITMDSDVLTIPLNAELKLNNPRRIVTEIPSCFNVPHYRHNQTGRYGRQWFPTDGWGHRPDYLDYSQEGYCEVGLVDQTRFRQALNHFIDEKGTCKYAVVFFTGRTRGSTPSKEGFQ